VISTDSHGIQEFDSLPYGVAQARRGWLTAGDVLNTLEADAFLDALKRPGGA